MVEDSQQIVIGPNALDRNPSYGDNSSGNSVIFRDCADCTLMGLHINGARTAEAGLLLENCNRFNVTGCTTNSRISGCLIRDDREGRKSQAIAIHDGSGNQIENNLSN